MTETLIQAVGDEEALRHVLDYHGPIHLDDIGYAIDQAPERNRLRAFWAATAFTAYLDTQGGFDTFVSHLTDLVADLRHLAAYVGIDESEFDMEVQGQGKRRWLEEAYHGE